MRGLFVALGCLALLGGPARAAEPPPAVFALVVGVNRSVDPQLPALRYADDDAARYADLFAAAGARTILLTRADDNTQRISPLTISTARLPRQSELRQAVAELAVEVRAARGRGQKPVLYFVYAGHGNVSGTDAYLALEDARLTGTDIEHAIIDAVHADESHLIVDACYSYFLAYGRGPGGRRRELHGFAPSEGLARREDVGLLLSTTVARESHEWEGFQAGVFSHEVRSGLYGAADVDGDGQVSYREIAAFVSRANEAIANERFRPEVFARPPRRGDTLLDLRGAPGRRLHVDAAVPTDHYVLEDTRGIRIADFHTSQGQALSLLLPAVTGPLYLRRGGDGRELVLPPDSGPSLELAALTEQEPRIAARGAAHDAFSLIFSLPFDETAVRSYAPASSPPQLPEQDGAPSSWRRRAGLAAVGLAAASTGVAVGMALWAHDLSDEAHNPSNTQTQTIALNGQLATRKTWAEAAAATAGASAIAAGILLFWPTASVHPVAGFDTASATLGVGGWF